MAFRRDLGGLRGGIVASRRDSSGVRGGIKGFRCVHTVAYFLGVTLKSNYCKAFRFVLLLV